jgi:hypothetical protein
MIASTAASNAETGPRLVRQAQVEENDIRGCSRDALEALATGVGSLDSVRGGREEVAHLVRAAEQFFQYMNVR